MLTMADSPTSTSAQQAPPCASPKEPGSDQVRSGAGVKKENGSPKSPKMRRACNKANRQRNAPYPDRSPGGSTCTSSDESNGEYENEETIIQKKIKRIAANKRERKRMHTVNSAFDQLRELVPTYPSNRKLSKIDTLRLACTYIQDLVSLLHNTHAIQGEDVQLQLYPAPMGDGYMQINGGYHVKAEMPEFSAFSPYRVPQSCITTDPSSTDYSTSESDNHSPPYFPAHTCQPTGLATRPPPLTRTNSDSSVAVYAARMSPPVSMQQQQQTTCPVSGSSMCQSQRQVNIPSPLATHSVQHTVSPPLLTSGVPSPHPPPPTWQRTGSVPTAYTLYTQ